MMQRCKKLLGRFRRSEEGSATLEFVITFPAMLVLMLSGFEVGMVSLNHAMLERAVDMTVREIRLGTGETAQHDELKDIICERAGFIKDCGTNLRLEMIQVDPRAWIAIRTQADCTDQSQEVAPVREFTNGQENELMFLRACAKIDPLFPTSGLGKSLVDSGDGAGQYALVSMSAFVQEPR